MAWTVIIQNNGARTTRWTGNLIIIVLMMMNTQKKDDLRCRTYRARESLSQMDLGFLGVMDIQMGISPKMPEGFELLHVALFHLRIEADQ